MNISCEIFVPAERVVAKSTLRRKIVPASLCCLRHRIPTVRAFRPVGPMVVMRARAAVGQGGRTILRRFSTAIICLFLLFVGIDTRHALAQDGLVTFKFTNDARFTIYMKMYSQNRNQVWPGAARHFVFDDNQEKVARLACQVGEKICYGGGYRTDGTGTYWGVGYRGNMGCRGCCLTCGSEEEDVWYSWTLTD
jgi:hypothetical protein